MNHRTLVKGGYVVVSPDKPTWDRPASDVLIIDGAIAEVGQAISAPGAEVIEASGRVVMPGFVDTHRHTWQTVLRDSLPDGTLPDYFDQVLTRGAYFTPSDVFTSNLLGTVGAMDAGITTLLDWSHISNTPEHSDAAIAALQVSGIRAVYAHSTGLDPVDRWLGFESTARHPDDLRRLVEQHGTRDDALLSIAAGLRGPEFCDYETSRADLRLARDVGARVSLHAGCSGLGARETVENIEKQGLLGPDITYIHTNTCSDRALELIADSGGTISSSPAVEAIMGHGTPPFARLAAAGLKPSLSVDTEVGSTGDMFVVMRAALQQARAAAHQVLLSGGEAQLPCVRDVLEWATLEGARTLGIDQHVGTLEPGKRADVVVLDLGELDSSHAGRIGPKDPAAIVTHGSRRAVTDVLVDGRFVKRHGHLVGLDVERLVADAARAAARLAAN